MYYESLFFLATARRGEGTGLEGSGYLRFRRQMGAELLTLATKFLWSLNFEPTILQSPVLSLVMRHLG